MIASLVVLIIYAVFLRKIRGASVVFLAFSIPFFIYSYYDRENFFLRAKSDAALKIGVEYILQKRDISDTIPSEFITKNPRCCSVSQYYDGQAESHVAPGERDKRSIFSVVNDKLFSLTGLEYYVVFVTFPGETSSSVVEISGNGGRGSSTIAKSPASIEGDGNGSH